MAGSYLDRERGNRAGQGGPISFCFIPFLCSQPVLVVQAAGREPVLEARCHGGVMMDNRRRTAEVPGRCFHCN